MKQSKTLGQKLYKSPLNHSESILVYRLYHIPKLSYPLSITKFSQLECEKIQSQFYRRCLPKIGLNRNMPKVLLFAPMSLGGYELHDLYCEQITQHIIKHIQHTWRMDNVGRAIKCNINALSVILGSNTPFFQLPRTQYMYGGQNTTLYYLWRMSTHWNPNIQYTGSICIRQNFINESRTIMDDAVADTQLKWNEEKLYAINACRLYHGLTFPSDLLLYNKKYVNKSYLLGYQSLRTTEQQEGWPPQPLPTDDQ